MYSLRDVDLIQWLKGTTAEFVPALILVKKPDILKPLYLCLLKLTGKGKHTKFWFNIFELTH
jgi:hypothetical protein